MKYFRFPILFAIVTLMFSSFSFAQVQDYYVSSSGSDSNDGSQARPWKTFSHANSALSLGNGGTIVHITPCPTGGPCYTGTINLSRSGNASQGITWQSDVPQGAKIDGVINVSGSYVTVKDFDITDTSTADDGITTLYNSAPPVYGQFVRLLGNYIHDIEFSSSAGCGGNSGILIAAGSHDFVVDSNIILRAGHWGGCASTGGTSAHGLYIAGYHGTVTNNQVSNVAGYGIELYHNPCQNVIANNTVFHNWTGGIQMASPADGLSPCNSMGNDYGSVNNNLLVRNGFGTGGTSHPHAGIIFSSGTGSHNKALNNFLAANVDENGAASNIIRVLGGTAPLQSGTFSQTSSAGIFLNYQDNGSGDYHLATGSPALSAGTANSTSVCAASPGLSPCLPTTDIADNVRPQVLSVGAYETATSSSAPVAPTGLVAVVQ
ncbi:MAG: right-handed parallel beta-helix repeat-containing protein [Terriglobales bacterium]